MFIVNSEDFVAGKVELTADDGRKGRVVEVHKYYTAFGCEDRDYKVATATGEVFMINIHDVANIVITPDPVPAIWPIDDDPEGIPF